MRFLMRAASGGAIALLCALVLALGARPFIACAAPESGTLSILGLEIPAGALLGDCALDRGEGRGGRAAQERSYTGRVGVVAYETAAPTLLAYGEVRSGRTLELRAPAAGRLVSVSDDFRDGAAVSAGQPLFEIDPADPAAARADAEAALADAKAAAADAVAALSLSEADLAAAEDQLRLRRRAVDRQRELRDRGTGSQSLLEEAEIAMRDGERAVIARDQAREAAVTRVEQTRLSVRRADIALAQAERDVLETAVTAPFDGVVQIDPADDAMLGASGATSLGRLVSVNERLGAVIDPAALEAAIRLSDAEFARLVDDAGALMAANATVTLGLGGRRISAAARLVRASATVAAGGGRIVYASLAPAADASAEAAESRLSLFRPGDFVEIRIQEPPLADVARLPASAVSVSGALLILEPDPAPAPAADESEAPTNAASADAGRSEGREGRRGGEGREGRPGGEGRRGGEGREGRRGGEGREGRPGGEGREGREGRQERADGARRPGRPQQLADSDAAPPLEGRLREASVQILRRQGAEVLVRGAPAGAIFVRQRSPQLAAGVRFRAAGPPTDARGDDGAAAAAPDGAPSAPSRDQG